MTPKHILIFILTQLCCLTLYAQSLHVKTGNVSYCFSALQTGDILYHHGKSLIIQGKEFPINDIDYITIENEMMADNQIDVSYSEEEAHVTISGNIASMITPTVTGAHVTITQDESLEEELTYSLSGTATDGSFTLSGNYKTRLELNGISLTNSTGPAIWLQNGKRIDVVLVDSTENFLTDSSANPQNACFLCKGHSEWKGRGSVTLNGLASHAIKSNEYMTVKNCSIYIQSAIKDGIHAGEYYLMESGLVNINHCGDNAIQSELKETTDTGETTKHIDEDSGNIYLLGGTLITNLSAAATKAIKADGNLSVTDAYLQISTTGDGIWDATENKTKASSCLNAGKNISISGGQILLTATGAGGKGINADGSIQISGGEITISTSGNAVVYSGSKLYNGTYTGKTDNISSNYKSSAKGLKADTDITIHGGQLHITTSGSGAEGIESKGTLTISDGQLTLLSADDALNSAGNLSLSGGQVSAISTGNDGIDSNGNIIISGGLICTFARGSECGLDAATESGHSVQLTGGTLLAVGGSNSAPSSSTLNRQAYISTSGSLSAGTLIQLKNGSEILATFTIPTEYASSFNAITRGGGFNGGNNRPGMGSTSGGGIIISSPDMNIGATYTLTIGSSTSNVTAQ